MTAAWPTGEENALGDLKAELAGLYDLDRVRGRYYAVRLADGPGVLTAGTLDGLESAIRADLNRSAQARILQDQRQWNSAR